MRTKDCAAMCITMEGFEDNKADSKEAKSRISAIVEVSSLSLNLVTVKKLGVVGASSE